MGPFELMDLIGHDVNYKVTSTVHEAFLGTPDTDPATPNASWSLPTGWGEKRDAASTPTTSRKVPSHPVSRKRAFPNGF